MKESHSDCRQTERRAKKQNEPSRRSHTTTQTVGLCVCVYMFYRYRHIFKVVKLCVQTSSSRSSSTWSLTSAWLTKFDMQSILFYSAPLLLSAPWDLIIIVIDIIIICSSSPDLLINPLPDRFCFTSLLHSKAMEEQKNKLKNEFICCKNNCFISISNKKNKQVYIMQPNNQHNYNNRVIPHPPPYLEVKCFRVNWRWEPLTSYKTVHQLRSGLIDWWSYAGQSFPATLRGTNRRSWLVRLRWLTGIALQHLLMLDDVLID